MTRIICDTMVWYYISQSKLQIPDTKKYILVCTHLTLMELAFTANNFKKLKEVQGAIKTILDVKPNFILVSPYEHAQMLIDSEFDPKYDIKEDLVVAFLRVLLNHPDEGLSNNEFKKQLLNITTIRKENNTDWTSFLNELNEPLKQIKRIFKKYHPSELERLHFQKWFVFQLNQLSDIMYSIEAIDWSNFELFEHVYKRYHRNLIVSKMKADINDDNDLKNTIYVQPKDLYWTLEKRWLNIIKEAKIEKYLYTE